MLNNVALRTSVPDFTKVEQEVCTAWMYFYLHRWGLAVAESLLGHNPHSLYEYQMCWRSVRKIPGSQCQAVYRARGPVGQADMYINLRVLK